MTLHRRDRQVIEAPEGIGQVLKEGKVVAKVSYTLFVEMSEIGAKSFGIPKETRLKHKSVRGKISVLEGALPRNNNPVTPAGSFTLVLQDGRKTDFFAYDCGSKSGTTQREYEIQGTGHKI